MADSPSNWTPSPDSPGWLIERRHPVVLNPLKVKLLDEFCYYCGLQLVICDKPTALQGRRLPDNYKTVDHKTPSVRGGGNEDANLVASCVGCNSDKGNLTLPEYRLVLAYREDLIYGADAIYQFWGETHDTSKPNQASPEKAPESERQTGKT